MSESSRTSYELIRDREGFAAVAAEWDALVRAKERPSPFLLHAWLDAWWAHHGGERQMQVHVASDAGRLVGGVPIEIERRSAWRVTTFMGRHHAALADILVAEDASEGVAEQLLAEVIEGGGDYGDFFGLSDSSTMARLASGRGRLIERVDAPVLDLVGGWDHVYRSRTSSKRRNLHSRRRKQLARLGELSVRIESEPDELAAALEHAFTLHSLRWEGRPDGSEFTTPNGMRFHRAAVRALAQQRIPRILLLELDGRPVAFQYYLLFERTMFVHRLAFDPTYGRYSPGQIAILAAIEAAAGEGALRVEFLGGGERYKLELADSKEPMYQLVGLARTRRGRLGGKVAAVSVEARLRLKRSRSLQKIYLDRLAPLRKFLARKQ